MLVVGLGILFAERLINSFLGVWLPYTLSERGYSATEIGGFFAIRNVISVGVAFVAWGCILWAAFGWRDTSTHSSSGAL